MPMIQRFSSNIKKLLDIFSYYSQHAGSKLNFYNCEIAGIGSLKGDEVAVRGIMC